VDICESATRADSAAKTLDPPSKEQNRGKSARGRDYSH